MKNKVLSVILFVCMLGMFSFGTIYANNEVLSPTIGDTGNENVTQVTDSVVKVYNTISIVVQVVGIAGIIIVGLKYMFTSADTRADMKKSMIAILIGCALLFSAGTVVNILTSSADDLLVLNTQGSDED